MFRARPNVWIDGLELAERGGRYAWRSRLAELRRPPFNMRIVNRQRRVGRPDGSTFVVSEYRFDAIGTRTGRDAAGGVPPSPAAA
jgi:hypothetical protein